ncbi:hypothetical protein CW751_03100 [Brumimicrobium salinarum]|uniref:Uncharacterized protein n=1 Tax=Brumimicrobium salinarum TaxID=2058658 RepID=A0A2I0R4P0_9FLAO|nr:hypothetical protein [Brumimicrobium salinarum]PKR81528.1 hypothetical protein CW751_03100 [Brumimicrobium salinarum]
MKFLIYMLLSISLLACGEHKGIRILNEKEYWDNSDSEEDRKLKSHTTAYQSFSGKFYHFKSYYENGILKSYIVMKDDLLENIIINNDIHEAKINYTRQNNENVFEIIFNESLV